MPGISAVPHEDNLRYFDVAIHGPASSPYEGEHVHRNVGPLLTVQAAYLEPNFSYLMTIP